MGDAADDVYDSAFRWMLEDQTERLNKGHNKRMTIAYITGAARWAKVGNGTPATFDEFKGKKSWTISVELDRENRKLIKELGLKLKLHEDDEGRFWINFRRPFEKNFGKGVEQLTPPEVFDGEGRDYSKILIGNESNVTVKIQTYQTSFKNDQGVTESVIGHRLDAVRVNDLKEYVPEEGKEDAGFPPVDKPVLGKYDEKVTREVTKKAIVEDSIPF